MKVSLIYTYYPVIQIKSEKQFFLLLIVGKLHITRIGELDIFPSVPARSWFWNKDYWNLSSDLSQQYIFSYL